MAEEKSWPAKVAACTHVLKRKSDRGLRLAGWATPGVVFNRWHVIWRRPWREEHDVTEHRLRGYDIEHRGRARQANLTGLRSAYLALGHELHFAGVGCSVEQMDNLTHRLKDITCDLQAARARRCLREVGEVDGDVCMVSGDELDMLAAEARKGGGR